MRRFTDGGEDPEGLDVWTGTSGGGNVSIVTTPVRSGNRAIRLAYLANYLYKSFPADTEMFFRIGIRIVNNNNGVFARFRKSTTELVTMTLDTANKHFRLKVGGSVVATGTFTYNLNTYYLLEWRVQIADAGLVQFKVDGVMDIDYSGDTKPGSDADIDNFYIASNAEDDCFFDDIAINDTTGGVDDSWCGEGKVIYIPTNAAGDVTQLTPNTGANYAAVDEATADGDTTYVEGDSVDEYDLYNLAACGLAAGSVIKRVIPVASARDTVADGGKVKLGIKTGGTEYFGDDITLTTSYLPISGTEQLINPQTGVAWTISDLDALQVGVKARGT